MLNDFIGVVVGLKSEEDAVRRALAMLPASDAQRVRIAVSGADAKRAEDHARAFAAAGARGLVSAGISGGLAPGLEPGALLVAKSVRDEAGEYPAHAAFLDAIDVEVGDATLATLLGVDAVVTSSAQKAELAQRFSAEAVDMESHAVARVAAEAGLAFIAIRAIADPAERALPPSTEGAIAPDGAVRAFSVMKKLAFRPGDLPALMALGRDQEKALAALRDGLGHFLPRFFRVV